MPEKEAMAWMCGGERCHTDNQIAEEINYFLAYYQFLHPVVFLSYEREAYYAKDCSDLRITFDDTLLCRQDELSLATEAYGVPLLPKDMVLMEIKCAGGLPLWMLHVLSRRACLSDIIFEVWNCLSKPDFSKAEKGGRAVCLIQYFGDCSILILRL